MLNNINCLRLIAGSARPVKSGVDVSVLSVLSFALRKQMNYLMQKQVNRQIDR